MDDPKPESVRAPTPEMAGFRARIDALDDQIIGLLAERFAVVRAVAEHKHGAGVPVVLQDRITEVTERNAARAAAHGIDPDLTRRLYRQIIEASCQLEHDLMAEWNASKLPSGS